MIIIGTQCGESRAWVVSNHSAFAVGGFVEAKAAAPILNHAEQLGCALLQSGHHCAMIAVGGFRTIPGRLVLALSTAGFALAQPSRMAKVDDVSTYTGSADVSGGVAVGREFFIVCEDEDSALRVYRRTSAGAPAARIDLDDTRALRVPGAKKELDLEAAARIGDKVFWIGSHGNNKDGEVAPSRRQLFATKISDDNGTFRVELVGQPYRRLVEDLIETPSLRELRLADAAASGRAAKDKGGLNIEGLAATPDGHLLLGFRNPVPQGRALIVPVLNPEEIIRGTRAKIGEPIRLDLAGRGIRDLVQFGREYLILAGAGDDDHAKLVTQLYRWSGAGSAPSLLAEFPGLNPEVIITYHDSAGGDVQVLSDDGRKPALPTARRSFRSVRVR